MDNKRAIELKIIANRIRKDALTAVYSASSGHPGGSLSIADALATLYFEVMNVDPSNPKDPDRDRFVLSKGHCAPRAVRRFGGARLFPVEDIPTFRKAGSYLQGHPDMKGVPGVDMSTGSLGQGVCAANGMALAAKIAGKDYRVYTILGDGELEEGQVWEAACTRRTTSWTTSPPLLILTVCRSTATSPRSCPPCQLIKNLSLRWNVVCTDAHDPIALNDAIEQAKAASGKPTVIILKSTKGKGVSISWKTTRHGTAPPRTRNSTIRQLLSLTHR